MWIKEPLLHFIVLGALVFGLYGFIGPDQPDDDEIVVSRGQQEHLVTAFTRTWQRPPTQSEFTGIVDDWIREEIAYREGQRLGLDANDTIIRRRLRQKLEVLADDIVSMAEPRLMPSASAVNSGRNRTRRPVAVIVPPSDILSATYR